MKILDKIFHKDITLEYRPRLYLSEGLTEKDLRRLKRSIAGGKGSCAVILLSENADDMLDIVTPFQLKLPVWKDKKPVVAGIAGKKDEAAELVTTIIQDCLDIRGDLNVKEYICSL